MSLVRSLVVVLALAAAVPAAAQDCITFDDFSKGKVGEFPPDWKPRKDEGRGVYTIQEQGGRRFLHAVSRGLGIQAGREVAWDLEQYPILAWSWRPVQFPSGADERVAKKNDSAVSVYAVFPHTPVSVKVVKYIWSEVVPVGTHLSITKGLTQVRVLRSGTAGKGEWMDEKVNVRDDYKNYFKTAEVPKPQGIAVLTDADETKSVAQGDYANVRACKP